MDKAQWDDHNAKVAERCERVTALARDMVAGETWLLQPDWRSSLADVLAELDRVVERAGHPDDVSYARAGIAAVASMFLTVEQVEAAYLGGAAGGAIIGG